jgi:DNA-binding IclR family transcriptional regulator
MQDMANQDGASLVQSVERALSILSCFSDSEPQLRVADLSRRLGLAQSTVSRMIATMESLGFVERDPVSGLVGPGLQLITLAGVALNQMDVQRQAQSELSAVAVDLGLAANLAILRNDRIFYLSTAEGPKAHKMFTMIGKNNPVHCTAMGKVLVAHLPDDQREQLLRRITYPSFTPNTVTSAAQMQAEVNRIVEQGYGMEREELAFGRACIAAPIRAASGEVVASASISGPLSALALEERQASLVSRVIEMTDRISRRLGWITIPAGMMANTARNAIEQAVPGNAPAMVGETREGLA